ncbi:hypothetical protein FB45DRAFT_869248 [Roridomyces roridus]|uniref:Uncharacterized protein n=1 Tax=Roridomyces roridus TaxID=1738132 RepID=A0AAD7BNP4_9AGAR|nr:hypothetical protein FB45DRAFT_869248 [Roridomyces roridus]
MQSQLDNAPTSTAPINRRTAALLPLPLPHCTAPRRQVCHTTAVSAATAAVIFNFAARAWIDSNHVNRHRLLGRAGGWPYIDGEQYLGMGLAQQELLPPTPASFNTAYSQSDWASPYTAASTLFNYGDFDFTPGQYPIDYDPYIDVNAQAGPEYYPTSHTSYPPTCIPTNPINYPFLTPKTRLDELDLALLAFGFNNPNVYAGGCVCPPGLCFCGLSENEPPAPSASGTFLG